MICISDTDPNVKRANDMRMDSTQLEDKLSLSLPTVSECVELMSKEKGMLAGAGNSDVLNFLTGVN